MEHLTLDDEAWLDLLFDRAVECVTAGTPVPLADWLAGRGHLRERAESIVALAQDVATPPGTGQVANVPAQIAGFTLLEEIGRGGMGTVFKARQESLGRIVALKVLAGALRLSARSRARFAAEAKALARVRHPNVVAIHEVVVESELCAFAMEWIDGSTLAREIAATGADRDPRAVARLGSTLARALAASHAAGLVHRDVKPSNILLRRDGTPVLSDFGLVRDDAQSQHTESGAFLGTAAYAAPEQLRGAHGSIGPWTDVYGLGTTLFAALAGTTPFATSSTAELLRQIDRGEATPLTRLNPGVPRDLVTVITKAIEADPARRYRSADALAEDLERFLRAEPIHARRAGVGLRVVRWTQRNPWQATAMFLLAAGAASSSVLAFEAVAQGREVSAQKAVAERRAAELDEVIAFQALQWANVDIAALGSQLRSTLVERAGADRRPSLEAAVDGIDFTSLAVDLLGTQLFDRSLAVIERDFVRPSLVKARLLQGVAAPLRELGLLQRAAAPQAEAVAIVQQELGSADPLTQAALLHHVKLMGWQGRWQEAVPLARECATWARHHGGSDESLVDAFSVYVTALARTGAVAEAEPVARELLRTCSDRLGGEHGLTLLALQGLGEVLQACGKFVEAERCLEQALAGQRRLSDRRLGDPMTTAVALVNLFLATDRAVRAEELAREVVEARMRSHGARHQQTLIAVALLGVALDKQDRLEEAEVQLRAAASVLVATQALDHPVTAAVRGNLGLVRCRRGDHVEAEALLREALPVQRRAAGDDDWRTIAFTGTLGVALRELGRAAEAEPLLRECLERRERLLGVDAPSTLMARFNLACLLSDQGDLATAITLLREVLPSQERRLGPDAEATVRTLSVLGRLLQRSRPMAEAEPVCVEAVARARRSAGTDRSVLANSLYDLGLLRQAAGRHDEAMVALREALESPRGAKGAEGSASLSTSYAMGLSLFATGKRREAIDLLGRVLEGRTRLLGADHERTLDVLGDLGAMCRAEGEQERERELLRQEKAGSRTRIGKEKKKTRKAGHNLGFVLVQRGELEAAEPVLADVLERRTRLLGAESAEALLTLRVRGDLLVRQRRFTEVVSAMAPFVVAARGDTAKEPQRPAYFLRTLGKAYTGLEQVGAFALGEPLLLEAHGIFTKALGEKHADTVACARDLAALYEAWHRVAPDAGLEAKRAAWASSRRR